MTTPHPHDDAVNTHRAALAGVCRALALDAADEEYFTYEFLMRACVSRVDALPAVYNQFVGMVQALARGKADGSLRYALWEDSDCAAVEVIPLIPGVRLTSPYPGPNEWALVAIAPTRAELPTP